MPHEPSSSLHDYPAGRRRVWPALQVLFRDGFASLDLAASQRSGDCRKGGEKQSDVVLARGQSPLQLYMPKLIVGTCLSQYAALMGIIEKAHQ